MLDEDRSYLGFEENAFIKRVGRVGRRRISFQRLAKTSEVQADKAERNAKKQPARNHHCEIDPIDERVRKDRSINYSRLSLREGCVKTATFAEQKATMGHLLIDRS